jgi:hypothetical protein
LDGQLDLQRPSHAFLLTKYSNRENSTPFRSLLFLIRKAKWLESGGIPV